jgi:hypothetical protein
MNARNVLDRFNEKVHRSTECWTWIARRTPQGYGRFSLRGKNRLAHRVAFELFVRHLDDGEQVLHRCDNPSCVRPDHLWIGDNAANVADKVRKGRAKGFVGESNPRALLRNKDIPVIRRLAASGQMQKLIAAQFNVRPHVVGEIVRGKNWRKVT